MVTARYCSHRSYNLYNYSMESALLLPHSEYEGNWGTERLTQLGVEKAGIWLKSVCLRAVLPSKVTFLKYLLCARHYAMLITCISFVRGTGAYHAHFQVGKLRCSLSKVT